MDPFHYCYLGSGRRGREEGGGGAGGRGGGGRWKGRGGGGGPLLLFGKDEIIMKWSSIPLLLFEGGK